MNQKMKPMDDIRVRQAVAYGLNRQQVVDSFYVRDETGRKLADPAMLVEIERALLHELSA